jgi:predicted site-specific integrase-resolvase
MEKPDKDFYLQTSGILFKRCKECIAKQNKRVVKVKGFAALDEQVQKDLIESLKGREKLVSIARRFELNYSTLQNWIRMGKIPL